MEFLQNTSKDFLLQEGQRVEKTEGEGFQEGFGNYKEI